MSPFTFYHKTNLPTPSPCTFLYKFCLKCCFHKQCSFSNPFFFNTIDCFVTVLRLFQNSNENCKKTRHFSTFFSIHTYNSFFYKSLNSIPLIPNLFSLSLMEFY